MVHWLFRLGVCGLVVTVQAQPTERFYLSGRGKDDAVPWRFMCTTGALSGFWTNIPVPSNWDVLGFGHLTYKKDYDQAITERGLYERDFFAPADWKDKRVLLVFEGVMTDTTAKLNGESVGPTHQGGFYRFKYEVTKLVRLDATNRLEVDVARHSANASVNKAERLADYWVHAGIYRPVYLEVVPNTFIERVAIDARADGSFAMDVFANGAGETDSVEARVMTLDGEAVGGAVAAGILPAVEPGFQPGGKASANPEGANVSNAGPGGKMPPSTAGRMPAAKIKAQIPFPKPWTAETPNLYNVEVRLKRGGEIIHTYKQRFGFRTFEVRDGDGLYLNGKKIILKGVNRHSSWPDSGRCLSSAVHRLDIETIKDMNGNAVRMSHYPPDVEFLDLCDELGLYVLDELAGWHNHYDTPTGTRLVEAMVTRDVNHPSILFWNNGNEGGFNPDLDDVFLQFDPQRRRVLHPWAPFSGINTAHYLAYDNARIAAAGVPMYYQMKPNQELVDTNLPNGWIYMPTEFMHGLYDGGAGAGLADYWTMMMSHSNCAGGFIWVFADEGIKNPHTGEMDTADNQAPDGIVGPYREREGSFYVIKQLWSPIQVKCETNGTFTVENHYSFTDASECKFMWETRQLWAGFGTNVIDRQFEQRESIVTHLPPGKSARLDFPLPADWGHDRANTLKLKVRGADNRELGSYAWASRTNQIGPSMSSFGPPRCTESPESIEITTRMLGPGGLFRVRISRQTGLLTEVWNDDRRFSFSGLRLTGGSSAVQSVARTSEGLEGSVTATFKGDLQKLVWTVRNDGQLICHYSFCATGTNDVIGVLFDYPEQLVKRKRWLGDGPYRVWKNRLGGGTLGLWENDYNNTITGYRGWVYPEFKGCFANVRWLQLETTEGLITVVTENIPFVQVLTPEFPPTNLVGHAYANLPKAGLGFLHAIPPIGSKFKPASTTGPQGQPNIGQGEYSGTVSFFFGAFPGEK